MIYYTSDLHFGHKNAIKFDNRPYSDVQEMDRTLIKNWNYRVQPEDTVYILGDICYRSEHDASWYLKRLNGHKFLILGNHDGPILNSESALAELESVEKMLHVSDEGRQIQLCHFPMADWNGMHRGSWHIYGHIHSNKNEAYEYLKYFDKALNAGCMINNYMPATFDELIENNKRFKNMN